MSSNEQSNKSGTQNAGFPNDSHEDEQTDYTDDDYFDDTAEEEEIEEMILIQSEDETDETEGVNPRDGNDESEQGRPGFGTTSSLDYYRTIPIDATSQLPVFLTHLEGEGDSTDDISSVYTRQAEDVTQSAKSVIDVAPNGSVQHSLHSYPQTRTSDVQTPNPSSAVVGNDRPPQNQNSVGVDRYSLPFEQDNVSNRLQEAIDSGLVDPDGMDEQTMLWTDNDGLLLTQASLALGSVVGETNAEAQRAAETFGLGGVTVSMPSSNTLAIAGMRPMSARSRADRHVQTHLPLQAPLQSMASVPEPTVSAPPSSTAQQQQSVIEDRGSKSGAFTTEDILTAVTQLMQDPKWISKLTLPKGYKLVKVAEPAATQSKAAPALGSEASGSAVTGDHTQAPDPSPITARAHGLLEALARAYAKRMHQASVPSAEAFDQANQPVTTPAVHPRDPRGGMPDHPDPDDDSYEEPVVIQASVDVSTLTSSQTASAEQTLSTMPSAQGRAGRQSDDGTPGGPRFFRLPTLNVSAKCVTFSPVVARPASGQTSRTASYWNSEYVSSLASHPISPQDGGDIWTSGRGERFIYVYAARNGELKAAIPIPLGVGNSVTALCAASCYATVKTIAKPSKQQSSSSTSQPFPATKSKTLRASANSKATSTSTSCQPGVGNGLVSKTAPVSSPVGETSTSPASSNKSGSNVRKTRVARHVIWAGTDTGNLLVFNATTLELLASFPRISPAMYGSASQHQQPLQQTSASTARDLENSDAAFNASVRLSSPSTVTCLAASRLGVFVGFADGHIQLYSVLPATQKASSPSATSGALGATIGSSGLNVPQAACVLRCAFSKHKAAVRALLPVAGGLQLWSSDDIGAVFVWRPPDCGLSYSAASADSDVAHIIAEETPRSWKEMLAAFEAGAAAAGTTGGHNQPSITHARSPAYKVLSPAYTLYGHSKAPLTSLVVTGREVWGAGSDGRIRIWSLATRQSLGTLALPADAGGSGSSQLGSGIRITSLEVVGPYVWIGVTSVNTSTPSMIRVIDIQTRSTVKVLSLVPPNADASSSDANMAFAHIQRIAHIRRALIDTVIVHSHARGQDTFYAWKVSAATAPVSSGLLPTGTPVHTDSILGGPRKPTTAEAGASNESKTGGSNISSSASTLTPLGKERTPAELESELIIVKDMLARLQKRFKQERESSLRMGAFFAKEIERLVLASALLEGIKKPDNHDNVV